MHFIPNLSFFKHYFNLFYVAYVAWEVTKKAEAEQISLIYNLPLRQCRHIVNLFSNISTDRTVVILGSFQVWMCQTVSMNTAFLQSVAYSH